MSSIFTLIALKIKALLGPALIAEIKAAIGALFSVICMATPLVAAGTLLVWYSEVGTPVKMTTQDRTYNTKPEHQLVMYPNVQLAEEIEEYYIKAWVESEEGEVIQIIKEGVFNVDVMLEVEFPPLAPGTYYVKALITYQLNPIKDSSLYMDLGKVHVF